MEPFPHGAGWDIIIHWAMACLVLIAPGTLGVTQLLLGANYGQVAQKTPTN